jgi:hypothetical protein
MGTITSEGCTLTTERFDQHSHPARNVVTTRNDYIFRTASR